MKSKTKNSNKMLKNAKVFVGMSGGVDSSVSTVLLKKAGYHVTGVFIKVWQPDWIKCNWKEDRLDAMRVCALLDIPFMTLDLEKKYKKEVIDYMITEYSIGRTPNPDVMCNKSIKFGGFYDWALKQGADYVATGHYARMSEARSPTLMMAIDKNKDQSYFLWNLKKEQLNHILFPIGHLTKPKVRNLAKKFKLPNAIKKDSQGLCFIGKIDIKEFLRHYTKGHPATVNGKILNISGQSIGEHSGSLFFTIGERHGLIINPKFKTPNDQPYYVISKDIKNNTLIVDTKKAGDQRDLSNKDGDSSTPNKTSVIKDSNWISEIPEIGSNLKARCRYRQPLQDIIIKSIDDNETSIEFRNRQDFIASGQSLVIYDGEVCVGGGVIC